jgi:hypothetical protein
LIVEVEHPELQPTRFARRDRRQAVNVDTVLFAAGIVTAIYDGTLPYPKRYPLVVYLWRAETHDAPRPEGLRKRTRARHPTYAESRDRTVAIRKATSWGRLPRTVNDEYALASRRRASCS